MHDDHNHGEITLGELKNLGPVSIRWLASIGIRNREQLEYVGVTRAYQLIISQYPEATLNLLWALQGALTGESWSKLSTEMRAKLTADVEALG